MLSPMRNRRGFTLIELLVVIAIIAILAAILMPVFAQAGIIAPSACILWWEGGGDRATQTFVFNHPVVTNATTANFPNRYVPPGGG